MVLILDGSLTVEADAGRLNEVVGRAIRPDVRHVVLDLERVGRLDCSGIGRLVQVHNRVCGFGRDFRLVNVPERQRRLLNIVGLLGVFHVGDQTPTEATEVRTASARPRGHWRESLDVPMCANGDPVHGGTTAHGVLVHA